MDEVAWWNQFLLDSNQENFDCAAFDKVTDKWEASDDATRWRLWEDLMILMSETLLEKTFAQNTRNPCGEISMNGKEIGGGRTVSMYGEII